MISLDPQKEKPSFTATHIHPIKDTEQFPCAHLRKHPQEKKKFLKVIRQASKAETAVDLALRK